MIVAPSQLGKETIARGILAADKKRCRRFGPCGVGEKALYLNSFFIDRRYYVAVSSVSRVFKRVAMSKGGFTGKGLFASIPYLVVVYDDGTEKQCNFKYEEQVDQMLCWIGQRFPHIKTVSAQAEERLRKREEERAKQKPPAISEKAEREYRRLERARAYLEERPALCLELSSAAKKKRTYDRTNPSYKWVALVVSLIGLAALACGTLMLVRGEGMAMYVMLFGLAALFLFSGAHVLPTGRNNKRAIEGRLTAAVTEMEAHIKSYAGFPLPAHYAHPIVLKRMAQAIRWGRAETAEEALSVVKEDLKRLNADVEVEQEEYDEVVAIKALFLIRDYQ